MLFSHAASARVLSRAEPLWLPGDGGSLWRVSQGVLRLDRPEPAAPDASTLVQLALPGDLVGLEALCALPYELVASALTPARLIPVDLGPSPARETRLQEVVMQLQRRSLDMAMLRTGTVPQRLAQLLGLLGHELRPEQPASPDHAVAIRSALPRLRELAQVIDAKTETVCRALALLLPAGHRRRGDVSVTPVLA